MSLAPCLKVALEASSVGPSTRHGDRGDPHGLPFLDSKVTTPTKVADEVSPQRRIIDSHSTGLRHVGPYPALMWSDPIGSESRSSSQEGRLLSEVRLAMPLLLRTPL